MFHGPHLGYCEAAAPTNDAAPQLQLLNRHLCNVSRTCRARGLETMKPPMQGPECEGMSVFGLSMLVAVQQEEDLPPDWLDLWHRCAECAGSRSRMAASACLSVRDVRRMAACQHGSPRAD
jgi:hypothetical protein